jgi:hypothetical protein
MTVQSLSENMHRKNEGQMTKPILYFLYAQAILLIVTYSVGVWLATELHGATITTPALVAHGILACGFALMSAVIGFLALVEKQKGVAVSNLALFAVTVVAGATGFAFLGNNSSANQILVTNLAMMTAIGAGIPLTGYSLSTIYSAADESRSEELNSPCCTDSRTCSWNSCSLNPRRLSNE